MDSELTLVTGVAGFVGSAVVRALAARGVKLRGIVRSSSPTVNLVDFPGKLIVADLRDGAAVREAMRDVKTVYHVAADYRLWAPDPEEIVRNNLAITGAVMNAALEAKVDRIVYTSSVATLLPDPNGPADETRAARPEQAKGAYKRSKVMAERLVEHLVAESGLPAVIVNPTTPVGPHDVRPTPTGRIVVEAASGRIPAFVDSGLNIVHVDDVAEGHLLARDRGRIGSRYILGGEDMTLETILTEIAHLVGRRPPRLRLPRGPLYPLAWLSEHYARASGREPFLTRDSLRMASDAMFFTSSKAADELGYTARPSVEALADAVAWFRQEGMLL